MKQKVQWGVLGTADIAVKKVIPAMQSGEWSEISALASRNGARARLAADELGIAKTYGSYEELLADPEIEAIYNPLPNDLHVPWTLNAAEAGKHVLCEKPIGLNVKDALPLLAARDRTGVKIQEAFMVRTHPQWLRIIDLVQANRIGQVRSIVGQFSYNNPDLRNIRNIAEMGGGGLMDIGCYLIFFARLLFQNDPRRVIGLIEEDRATRTDVLTSALLDFPEGQAVINCGTRMTPFQRIQIIGATGRIEVQIPVNAPPDRACRILIDDGSDLFGAGVETIEFDVCDQYTIQGDLFSRAIREGREPIISLEDSLKNMSVIDAVFASAKSGRWEVPETI